MRTQGRASYEGALDIPEGRSGKVSVRHILKRAGEGAMLNTMRTALVGGQRAAGSVTYDHATRWHSLEDDDHGVWMTDLPIEQRQCDEEVARMRGSVLVGGLGLGYAVTALVARRSVRRIVVVERSPDVAKLVWPHLGLAVHAKAELVVEDLFAFLRERKGAFAWAFYDIWQADSENTFHTVVVPLLRLTDAGQVSVKHVACWNEGVMRGQLYMGLVSRLHARQADPDGPLGRGRLCDLTPTGSVYTDWAVPFWRWHEASGPTLKHATTVAARYASTYGRREHLLTLAMMGDPDGAFGHGAPAEQGGAA